MVATVEMARLEARISKDSHALLKRAAEIQGRTMTDFVVSVVQEAAKRVIEESDVFKLSLADQKLFAKVLLSAQEPSENLKKAFAHRKNLIISK